MKEYDVKTVLYVVIKYLFRKVISFFKDAFTSKFVLIYMTFIFVFFIMIDKIPSNHITYVKAET